MIGFGTADALTAAIAGGRARFHHGRSGIDLT
jgi:hypothetical protein